MPSFDTDKPAERGPIKMIYLGNTGAGKSGSLAALAAAGYTVRIMDLDKGVEILRDYVRDPHSPYTKANAGHWTAEQAQGVASRLSYVSLTEGMLVKAKNIVPRGDLWGKISEQLDDWKDGEQSFGNISTWGEDVVLVIDGLSRLAQAAFNFQLKLNGRLLQQPQQSDYWHGQQAVLRLLMLLYSEEVKCNVILVCHIHYSETPEGTKMGFPQAVGSALGPQVGQFFNHALLAQQQGSKRVILTNTKGLIQLKSAAPLKVKGEYPIESGLADYFREVRGEEAPK